MKESDFEKIYTITDWYDGAIEGIANFQGEPHYYKCNWDKDLDNYSDTYSLQKIDDETFRFALEDWEIWEKWEKAFKEGRTTQETHPALPEDKAKHKILTQKLKKKLVFTLSSFTAIAEFKYGEKSFVKWKVVDQKNDKANNSR